MGSASDEVSAKLRKANIVSLDLLRSLSMHDWEATGVSVGAARAIQDALWQLRHDTETEQVEKTLKLHRENSSKLAAKQKRL